MDAQTSSGTERDRDETLTAAQRAEAAASALGSVRAEGLDTSMIEPALQAWVAGEVNIDELIEQQLAAAAAEYGQPSVALSRYPA